MVSIAKKTNNADIVYTKEMAKLIVNKSKAPTTEKDVYDILNTFVEVVINELIEGKSIFINHLGIFYAARKGGRVVRNPKHNVKVWVDPFLKPEFRPSVQMKSRIRSNGKI